MTPDRDRQRSYRQRQRDRGKARVALWLTPVQLAALDARRGRESRTAYLGRLVAADLEIPFRPPPEASGEAPGPTPAD